MVHRENEQEDNCFGLPWLRLHIDRAFTESILIDSGQRVEQKIIVVMHRKYNNQNNQGRKL